MMPSVPPAIIEYPIRQGSEFDLDSVITLEQIREYAKIDDVPMYTDEMLRMYRDAAFEAAELYTGRIFRDARRIVEDVSTRRNQNNPFLHHRRGYSKFNLRYPCVDGQIYLYGGQRRSDDRLVIVEKNARTVRLPIVHEAFDAECCRPCGSGDINHGLKIMYLTGVLDKSDIEKGIVLGVLKYIAWTISNPGDVYRSVEDSTSKSAGVIQGTNNTAWASGALEMWRQYVIEV